MPGFKLNHVSKRGPRWHVKCSETIDTSPILLKCCRKMLLSMKYQLCIVKFIWRLGTHPHWIIALSRTYVVNATKPNHFWLAMADGVHCLDVLSHVIVDGHCVVGPERDLVRRDWLYLWVWPWFEAMAIYFPNMLNIQYPWVSVRMHLQTICRWCQMWIDGTSATII